jgi:hypothetical protein
VEATMSVQQQTMRDRETAKVDAPKDGPEAPAHTGLQATTKAVLQDIAQSRPMQVGLGVGAAAVAGLFLVSMVGAGAAAVAGAAGYLAYRELKGKSGPDKPAG